MTRGQLRADVAKVATGLLAFGIREGDRIIAVARNTPEVVVVALACAAIGATWSAAAPDMGPEALLTRFGQLGPALLVCHGDFTAQGVKRDLTDRLANLRAGLPALRGVLPLDTASAKMPWGLPVLSLKSLRDSEPMEVWTEFPFDHPLYILFSSGTTGIPKGIVHGAGGTLLEHLKEHRLHGDLGYGDVLLYQTTCGWMMWNWLVSAIATGAAIVCYDGSPTHPTMDHFWKLTGSIGVTVLGTNPTYLSACQEADVSPRSVADLSKLRSVLSTGSVLRPHLFDWVRDHVGPVPLQSISGGTDIIGCFFQGNPLLPVYRGECQCVGLGMDVRVQTAGGLESTGIGELVCVSPFPSRPVYFVSDPTGDRLHATYFAQHVGLWTHGDTIELTDRGTAIVHGRSDGTLNVRGVRIGPAEIYGVVLQHVREAMALEQPAPREPGGSRLVLLVVLAPGVQIDRAFVLRLKRELAARLSPNHVPAVVAQVEALPITFSGKVSDRAVRDVLAGREAANISALRNPESLVAIARHPALQVL
jgi:acetoacetyl-CoA synthetase